MQPIHNLLLRFQNATPRQGGAVHNDDGHAQFPRRIQFRPCANATGIFGDDHVDGVVLQKGAIPGQVKGASGDFKRVIGQGNGGFGLIHKAQQIVMRGRAGKEVNILFANRQKDAAGRIAKRVQNTGIIRDMLPCVARTGLPRRAFKTDQRRVGLRGSIQCIARHLRGEWVGGINDMCDVFRADIINQTINTAKAANTGWQGLAARTIGAPGIGKNGICTAIGQMTRKARGLGRAAQKKDFLHV